MSRVFVSAFFGYKFFRPQQALQIKMAFIMDSRTVGTNWSGTVRGKDFWYENLVRNTQN